MENNKERELDLLDLLSIITKAIGRFCKNAIKYFLLTIIFSFKKALYFIPFLLIGIGIAFYLTMPEKRTYRAEVILRINDGDSFTLNSITKALNSSYIAVPSKKKDIKKVAAMLNTTPEVAASLTDVQAFYLIDLNKNGTVDYIDYKRSFVEDTSHVVVRNQIAIRFESTNPANFYAIKDGFIHYLSDDEFLSQQRDTRQAHDRAQVKFYTAEIAKLDSLSNIEYFQKGDKIKMTSKDGVMMVSSDKQLFQNQLIELNNSRRYHERRLEEGNDVVFLTSSLIIDNKPVLGRLKALAVSIVASYLIGLISLLLIFNRKKIGVWLNH